MKKTTIPFDRNACFVLSFLSFNTIGFTQTQTFIPSDTFTVPAEATNAMVETWDKSSETVSAFKPNHPVYSKNKYGIFYNTNGVYFNLIK